MREAGFGGGFKTYKNLTVDNGSDIAGTDATGEFVELSFDDEAKKKIKTQHGKELEGVILLSRAVLTYRDNKQTKKKIWETEEFNPLLNKKKDKAKALIPIYKLDFNGQRQKNEEGKFIVDYAFYEDLASGKKQNLKGMDYVYTIVLYVLIFDDESGQKDIIKLRFKGASRGNFFKYQQRLWREFRTKAANVFTKLSVYLEKEYNKYAIAFNPILQEDGQPKKYHDPVEIENEIGNLISDANNKRTVLLPPIEQNILKAGGYMSEETPTPIGQGSPEETEMARQEGAISATPPPQVQEDEGDESKNDDEIKVKDIPF